MSQFISDIKYLRQQAPATFTILSLLRQGYKHPQIIKMLDIPSWKFTRTLRSSCDRYNCASYYQLICDAAEAGVFKELEI